MGFMVGIFIVEELRSVMSDTVLDLEVRLAFHYGGVTAPGSPFQDLRTGILRRPDSFQLG